MSKATTLRISARQLADAAYRALRVAHIPSGAAADAARDVVELERRRGRGLEVLDRILNTGPSLPSTTCETHGASTSVDARGGSALLLAVPLVALACELPSPLMIYRLDHCASLEPVLARRAGAEHRRFELTLGDGTPVLGVDPAHSAIDAGWCAAWELPLDVRLTVHEAGTSHSGAPVEPSADRPLMVAAQCWERLSERAAPYLV